jgi:signal transduction histidine kinase
VYQNHDLPRLSTRIAPATTGAHLPIDVLDFASRELIAPVWSLGMRTSALRVPAHLSVRERELLEFVDVHVQRIARVLTGVLDFVHAEKEGTLPIDALPCDLGLVCEAAIDSLREAGFTSVVDYERDGESFGEWDPERLAQAISYLVEVAAESAPPSAPVRLRWRSDADEVTIRVEAGHGRIPSRIDAEWGEVLEEREGGLKAFLARRIALGHGGTLARFATGGATTYIMVLPRNAPEDLDHDHIA